MDKLIKLIIKFVLTFIAAWIAFDLIDDNSFSWIIIAALIITILNYIIGDLLILPKSGNFIATIADGGLALLTAYILDILSDNFDTSITGLILFAIIVMIFEWFFHNYLEKEED